MSQIRIQLGFTLIELMVTVSLMAIALTIAVPSYKAMIANNRSATEVNRFLTAINITRSEAVKRGIPVTLCARKLPRTLPESCSGDTDWSTGLIMFSDNNGTKGVYDSASGDILLYVWDRPDGNPVITAGVSNIQYLPTGDTNKVAAFSYYFPGCKGNQKKTININLTGRASISSTACG